MSLPLPCCPVFITSQMQAQLQGWLSDMLWFSDLTWKRSRIERLTLTCNRNARISPRHELTLISSLKKEAHGACLGFGHENSLLAVVLLENLSSVRESSSHVFLFQAPRGLLPPGLGVLNYFMLYVCLCMGTNWCFFPNEIMGQTSSTFLPYQIWQWEIKKSNGFISDYIIGAKAFLLFLPLLFNSEY